MLIFIISVLGVLATWALCSLLEAAMYAVRMPYVRQLVDSGHPAGKILARFKANMEQPISAILIVNTAVSAAGAAVTGAQAQMLFGETALVWFSVGFSFAALFLAEIFPKIAGVAYCRPLARGFARPLLAAVTLLAPLIWMVQRVTHHFKPRGAVLSAPEEEVKQLAQISAEEGSIMPYEADLVRNVLHLDRIETRQIMTPRPVVLKLPADWTVKQVGTQAGQLAYSRIPLYREADPETWVGFVLTREVLAELASDHFSTSLESLAKPLFFVSEKTPGHILMREFLRRRCHLFGVIDEYGDVTGIVTFEDVLESLIGEEIVDETDRAVDMREVALLRKQRHFRQTAPSSESVVAPAESGLAESGLAESGLAESGLAESGKPPAGSNGLETGDDVSGVPGDSPDADKPDGER